MDLLANHCFEGTKYNSCYAYSTQLKLKMR